MVSLPMPVRKIGVFRALQLGDLLCAIPALRALRDLFPGAEIVLIGLPWSNELIGRFPDIFNRHMTFPGFEGLPEQPYNGELYAQFVSRMLQEGFDLLLQMQGRGGIVNDMMSGWGGKQLAGFYPRNEAAPGPFFIPYPETGPEMYRHLALIQHLGGAKGHYEMEFPVHDTDRDRIKFLLTENNPQPFVCIHPGSRAQWRQWPPAMFARLGDYAQAKGFRVIITGTKSESAITGSVLQQMKGAGIDATGKTNLGSIAALIDESALLVANCTGVSHIAAARKKHSFIISMDGEPERWGPVDGSLHTVVDLTTGISDDEVLALAKGMINRAATQWL